MKTAIYIEDGLVQLVITPTTEFEKNALSNFQDKLLQIKIHEGSFYDCRGGWIRQTTYQSGGDYSGKPSSRDRSIILTIREPQNDKQKKA